MSLVPISQREVDFLYQAHVSDGPLSRWRNMAGTPNKDDFARQLWAGTLAQFLVVSTEDRRPVGLVSSYGANHRDGYCYIAVSKIDEKDRSGSAMEGLALLLDYLFQSFTFRKVYAEVAAYSLPSFQSATETLAELEGTLVNHEFRYDRYWDHHIFSISRVVWAQWAPVILGRVKGNPFRQPSGTFLPTRSWAAATAEVSGD